MATIPPSIKASLAGHCIIVAGVSRWRSEPANAIFRCLRDTGHEVIPVNPVAHEIEGVASYPDIPSIAGKFHQLMVVTHSDQASVVVRSEPDRGINHIWFHHSFGTGNVRHEAAEACRGRGVKPILDGCPLMYCPPWTRDTAASGGG